MPALPSYVLITPARNEARYIELTIRSMVGQTYRPRKWVIASDGSTDGTDDIVNRYVSEHPWIELVRTPERRERHFAGKVHAFNAGRARIAALEYDVIGNLDADLSFGPEHFELLLSKFAEYPDLGIVGAPFREGNSQYDYRFSNIENVSGACQLFRRECFDAIGGYVPLKGGSIDHIAVVTARMRGWKTRTFTGTFCLHHRAMGTAQHGSLAPQFQLGMKDYAVGNHALWEAFRVIYQMSKRPFVTGGLVLGAGYGWACLRRNNRPVSREFIAFTRREQMQRLKRFFAGRTLSFGKSASLASDSGT